MVRYVTVGVPKKYLSNGSKNDPSFYFDITGNPNERKKIQDIFGWPPGELQYDGEVNLSLELVNLDTPTYFHEKSPSDTTIYKNARFHGCLCSGSNGREYVAICVRGPEIEFNGRTGDKVQHLKVNIGGHTRTEADSIRKKLLRRVPIPIGDTLCDFCKYSTFTADGLRSGNSSFLNSVSLFNRHLKDNQLTFDFDLMGPVLYDEITKQFSASSTEPLESGLVAVFGETGTGKTELTVRMILEHLLRKSNKIGRPHLITYEDPVEKWLFDGDLGESLTKGIFDYTPRIANRDCDGLKNFYLSALRQKPAAAYVGEIREVKDWKTALEIAGTSHVVFATGHASGLPESIDKILQAGKGVSDRHRRAVIANRLAAVIHIKSFQKEGEYSIKAPSLWVGTTSARAQLIADGLRSVLPYSKCSRSNGNISKSAFAEKFIETYIATLQKTLTSKEILGRLTAESLKWLSCKSETECRKKADALRKRLTEIKGILIDDLQNSELRP